MLYDVHNDRYLQGEAHFLCKIAIVFLSPSLQSPHDKL